MEVEDLQIHKVMTGGHFDKLELGLPLPVACKKEVLLDCMTPCLRPGSGLGIGRWDAETSFDVYIATAVLALHLQPHAHFHLLILLWKYPLTGLF